MSEQERLPKTLPPRHKAKESANKWQRLGLLWLFRPWSLVGTVLCWVKYGSFPPGWRASGLVLLAQLCLQITLKMHRMDEGMEL